ncbi:MAG: lipoprotein insertase outer membrane protein LolB [Methylococcaceae bacterium]
MMGRAVVVLMLAGVLASCAEVPVRSIIPFELVGREHLYDKTAWSFSGRLALSGVKDAISASISWRHQADQDEIELAGPFGQGRTLLVITNDSVVIDYGDQRLQHNGNVDEFISRHTGIEVPVSALKYWVLGLIEPNRQYVGFENGFLQSGWNVSYLQMQPVESDWLPRKIRVQKSEVKLKLIISQWEL